MDVYIHEPMSADIRRPIGEARSPNLIAFNQSKGSNYPI